MGIWEWATAVLAIWGAVSIMAGVFWGLIGRRIFRPRPTPVIQMQPVTEADKRFVAELKRRIADLDGEQ